MPLYTVSSRQHLSEVEKQKIVEGITEIHCDLTGAPSMFVQVIFSFGVTLHKATDIHLLGSIRSGRTPEVKRNLETEFRSLLCRSLGKIKLRADIVLIDVPASWVLEGGEILPEPGEEDVWLARYNAKA